MTSRLKRMVCAVGLGPLARPAVHCFREQRTALGRMTARRGQRLEIERFLMANKIRKVNIGACDKVLPGWLNTDLDPMSPGVIFLDATQPLPFPNESLDYVFCEHFIEHLSREDAERFLTEVNRCLRPRGVVRLATPDLDRYVKLFGAAQSCEHAHFCEHYARFSGLARPSPCAVLNHIMHNWGHRFIWTIEEIDHSIRRTGFASLRLAAIGESEHEALCGIERHGEYYGEEMNRLETMVVEATKA